MKAKLERTQNRNEGLGPLIKIAKRKVNIQTVCDRNETDWYTMNAKRKSG